MKSFTILVVGLLLIAFMITGCGTSAPTATSAPPQPAVTSAPAPAPAPAQPSAAPAKPPAATSAAPQPSATAAPPAATTQIAMPSKPQTGQPVKGGTLRVISVNGPTNLSYVPEQNMVDETAAKAYAETLVYWAGNGEFKPELAKSWDLDEAKKTLTFHLQEGVSFQDGTPFNAYAVQWNVQLLIDNKRLANGQYVKSTEVLDNYTFRYNLSGWMSPPLMLHSYGYNLLTMYSPNAFQKNGKAWCTTHFVSTGAFKFDKYQRDVSLRVVRYDNYWRGPQYPYMDAIEFIFVADNTIASTKMQAKEGDAWGGPPLKEANDLIKLGLVNYSQPNMYGDIVPDNKTEGPFKNLKVRQALEYAIDKEGLAAAFGYGLLKPVNQVGPVGSAGYNPAFQERKFDLNKAKALLKEAGYPNGFNTTILSMQMGQDQAAAIQAMLGQAGIQAKVDLADMGRFFGALYGSGWNGGLLLFSVPVDPIFCIGWFVHFGPRAIFPYPSLVWPPEYKTLTDNVYNAPDAVSLAKATQAMITLVDEQAMIIPTFNSLTMYVTRPYVKTNRYQDHFMVWHTYEDYMEAH